MLITRAKTYDEIYRAFRWQLPDRMNIAALVCDRHAARSPDRTALLHERCARSGPRAPDPPPPPHERGDGSVAPFSFGLVQRLANQCAHTFDQHLGLQR